MVFIDAAKSYLDIPSFGFDFAADETNTKALRFWGEEVDSLSRSAEEWVSTLDGRWGWLNPPYANIGQWAKRCAEVATLGGKIAFLVPAGVGANWYRDYVHDAYTHTLFLNGRIPFMPDKPTWLYPKDCILVLYARGYQGNNVWSWRKWPA
ncbi:MAG: phage N-6-adenine-methyltransferase [Acidobacteriota bacterium]|nr:phage N-6-adenine-methyltransferase [Acidobacteriota bacterium]